LDRFLNQDYLSVDKMQVANTLVVYLVRKSLADVMNCWGCFAMEVKRREDRTRTI